jgi:putative PIN family toxin of toxin-antitoxin system
MNPLRLVLDTNVYIAAAQTPGGYADYWLRQAGKQYRLYVSPEILAEMEEKLDSKLGFDRNDIALFRKTIEKLATVVRPTRRITVIEKDPDDNKILECAVAAGADLIISADPHLYRLKLYEGIQIRHSSDLKYIFPSQSPEAA